MTDIFGFDALPDAPPPAAAGRAPQAAPQDFPEYEPGGGGRPTRITVRPQRPQPPQPADAEISGTGRPAEPQVSQGEAAAVNAVQGLTANFGDEMQGAMAAGQAGATYPTREPGLLGGAKPTTVEREQGPVDLITGLARMGYESLTGKNDPTLSGLVTGQQPKGDATKSYEEARDRWRATVERSQKQWPKTSTVAQLGGAMLVPVGGAAGAGLGLGARTLRGAVTGATTGGLAGAGEGTDLADRAVKAGSGAAVGTAIGTVAPGATDLVVGGVRATGRSLANLGRSLARPNDEAERRVAQQVINAQTRGGNDVVPIGEMAARQAEGQPVTVLDVAGQGGRKLARSAKNTPNADEGTQALQGMVEERFRSQAERTAAFLDRHTPWKNNATFERILENSRSVNAPAYGRAYADGRAAIGNAAAGNYNPRAFLTPELVRLAGAPDIARAFGSVGRKEGNRTIIEGFQSPRQSPFARNDRGRLDAAQFPNGNTAIPDLPAWDQVQRVLRAKAASATQAGDRDSARQLILLRQQLLAELDRIVPSFQAARGTAWRGFRAEDAYEAGGNYVTSNATGREAEALRRQIAGMTQDEQHLFASGFAQELIGKVRGVSDSADVVRRIYNSPVARERIAEALGPRMARDIDAFLHVEAVMNYARNAVQGNSTTVAQLLSAGMAGSLGYGAMTGNWDVSNLAAGAAAAGGRRVMMGAQARMADRIGELLASNDPRVFARGMQMLGHSNRMVENLRESVGRIAGRALPPQATQTLLPDAVRNARPEDEPVPGP